ncbi:Septum formation [Nakamurella panacisegetis]|uniref:Septum formation n=1 Tax=Nakamurella panacisegetis TaxID=1090615 RepID=A0A1H0I5Q3_9ACTN|nr:septum formation family protein [Nakamurella panacisegetis]SDO26705.1 Septum formation [Nakamurella panacisegetis]
MDKRFVGAVLIALMAVAVITVPGVLGRRLTGSAAPALHVNPPLEIGNCLGPLNTPQELNTIVDVVPVVACTRAHSAEVIAVGRIDPVDYPVRPTVADAAFTSGPLSEQCDQAAAKFLGWGTKNTVPRIQVSFFTRLTIPGELEWRLGQRWYACELMPGVLDYPISYDGTAQNASFRTPPDAFANCADGPGETRISCREPHHAEQLTSSYGKSAGGDGNCRALVAKVIGTSDPTFNGQLAVLSRVQGGASQCWVTTTSSRYLTATLINHGSRPLPLQ